MSEATKGQDNRKNIRKTMESRLPEYCPNSLDRVANLIAYDFNLSPYTVRYTYLPMFIDKGVLTLCEDGNFDVSATEKQKQQLKTQKQKEMSENIAKISDQREQLTKTIETELRAKPKFSLADAVQKYSSKTVDEDEVTLCYDNAKFHIDTEKNKEP